MPTALGEHVGQVGYLAEGFFKWKGGGGWRGEGQFMND